MNLKILNVKTFKCICIFFLKWDDLIGDFERAGVNQHAIINICLSISSVLN